MKKGMKKILSVAIVLAMTMSLAACGGGTKETSHLRKHRDGLPQKPLQHPVKVPEQKPERPLLVKSRGAAH